MVGASGAIAGNEMPLTLTEQWAVPNGAHPKLVIIYNL